MPKLPKSPAQSADPFAEVAPESARQLLAAAVEAFAEEGYHATTTRTISTRAGLSPAALYVHFSSKADLLFAVSEIGHRHVLEEVESAVAGAVGAPDRLEAFVRRFGEWHALNHTLARVVQYELGSLDPKQLAEVAKLRRDTDQCLRRVLREGEASGDFAVADVAGTSLTILSIGIDIARWYTPGRGRSAARIGALQADLVGRMVAPAK